MKAYKECRCVNGKFFPLFVNANKEMPMGVWMNAEVGELVDETHVKARGCGGKVSLYPGFHLTSVPWAGWIGKRMSDGTLAQRKDTVWVECEIDGEERHINGRSRTLVNGWYYAKTNSKQLWPWIVASRIKINRILSQEEVAIKCREYGYEPQEMEA